MIDYIHVLFYISRSLSNSLLELKYTKQSPNEQTNNQNHGKTNQSPHSAIYLENER